MLRSDLWGRKTKVSNTVINGIVFVVLGLAIIAASLKGCEITQNQNYRLELLKNVACMKENKR